MPPNELATFIDQYLGSIYEMGEMKKFKKIGTALLKDTDNYSVKNPFLKRSRMRLSYLIIETIFSEDTPESYLILENKIKNFKKKFKESSYKNRLDYLLGISLINNKRQKEGEEVLKNILKNKEVPNHLKELVNSELTLLKINNRTI